MTAALAWGAGLLVVLGLGFVFVRTLRENGELKALLVEEIETNAQLMSELVLAKSANLSIAHIDGVFDEDSAA